MPVARRRDSRPLSCSTRTPLYAVAITGPGRPAPSIAELADKTGLARAVIAAAGTAERVWNAPRVVEQLYLGVTLILLFEDPAEASAFEVKLSAARARAARTKGPRVKSRKQAVAIALSEAGQSKKNQLE